MCLTGCQRIAAEARFVAKLETRDGCRVWTGALSRGGNRPHASPYGSFYAAPGIVVRAHVFAAYIAGIISDLRVPCGMNLDHNCKRHGTMCVDCLQLIPAVLNRQLAATRPIPKTDVPYRTKPKRRKRVSRRASGNPKSLPVAKIIVALSELPVKVD